MSKRAIVEQREREREQNSKSEPSLCYRFVVFERARYLIHIAHNSQLTQS